jgi:hypothetical protein
MIKDFIAVITGVVFLKIKDDKDSITIENVTTLQVRNNGISSVFVNDFEIASKESFVIVPPDGTISKIDLNIRFDKTNEGVLQEFSSFTWNKKEIDIIYKKFIRCKN